MSNAKSTLQILSPPHTPHFSSQRIGTQVYLIETARMLRRGINRLAQRLASTQCGAGGEIYGPEHHALQDSLRKMIETEINPHVPEWEAQKQFPVKEVIKKFGEGGFLGASFPEEDGGMGLDYSYTVTLELKILMILILCF